MNERPDTRKEFNLERNEARNNKKILRSGLEGIQVLIGVYSIIKLAV